MVILRNKTLILEFYRPLTTPIIGISHIIFIKCHALITTLNNVDILPVVKVSEFEDMYVLYVQV